jgi:hypothetical protein
VLLGSLLGAPLGAGCSWEPIARNVQPVRVLEGPARVLGLIDAPEGRYAIAAVGTGDALRRHIVHVEEKTTCALPAGAREVGAPLHAPNQRGSTKVLFLQPLVQGEGIEGRLPELWYTDEKCTLRGPFGSVASDPDQLALRADGRAITLVLGDNKDLRIVDPWTNAVRPIASGVSGFAQVQQPGNSTAPQAIWLLESGKLTQRALDGTLLLALGKAVDSFQQLFSDQLRVAYHDGQDVFEAKGPDFTPVLIAEDACQPEYAERSLELKKPCAANQLVRIDLTTAEVKTFAKGVSKTYTQGDVSFEIQQPEGGGNNQVWVSVQGVRAQLVPTPNNAISALDRNHVAGRTEDGQFGIWSTQPFVVGFKGVQQLSTFRDVRTGQLMWLMLYDVVGGIGKLVLLEQEDLMRITVGLPPGVPTTLSEHARVNAYRVINTSALPEPIVLSLESPITMPDEHTIAGTLFARFLSGTLGSKIDDGVASSEIVIAPVPGILYGIMEGPKSGLWFAAL